MHIWIYVAAHVATLCILHTARMYINKHICIQVLHLTYSTCMYMHINKLYIYTLCIDEHVRIRVYTHAYIQPYAHTHIHAYIEKPIYAYTYIRILRAPEPSVDL